MNLPDRESVSSLSCHASTINVNVPWKWEREKKRKNKYQKNALLFIFICFLCREINDRRERNSDWDANQPIVQNTLSENSLKNTRVNLMCVCSVCCALCAVLCIDSNSVCITHYTHIFFVFHSAMQSNSVCCVLFVCIHGSVRQFAHMRWHAQKGAGIREYEQQNGIIIKLACTTLESWVLTCTYST